LRYPSFWLVLRLEIGCYVDAHSFLSNYKVNNMLEQTSEAAAAQHCVRRMDKFHISA
jgi:hypothetical protein